MRSNDRAHDEVRPLAFELSPIRYAEGAAKVTMGNTQVLCAVSVEDRVPRWLQGQGKGWLTAGIETIVAAQREVLGCAGFEV